MIDFAGPSTATPLVDCQRCSACGRCVSSCPEKLYTLEVDGFRKTARRQVSPNCRRCFVCGHSCPIQAISPPEEFGQNS